MAFLEILLLGLAVLEGGFGIWAVCLTHTRSLARIRWGQRLCLLALVVLGLTTMLAAYWRAFALTPLGLGTGLLVVACVCEFPRPAVSDTGAAGLLLREQHS